MVDWQDRELRGERLTGQEIVGERMLDLTFDDCDLSAVQLVDVTMARVRFVRCRMTGLVAPNLRAIDVHFDDCKLDEANFRFSTWEGATFSGCDLSRAEFCSARLATSRFDGCVLVGTEFDKASMAGTRLHGSRLDGIRGGEALRGVVIGTDQVVPLSFAVFAGLDIQVEDEELT